MGVSRAAHTQYAYMEVPPPPPGAGAAAHRVLDTHWSFFL